MARVNFYQMLEKRNFNAAKEFERLQALFANEYSINYHLTLKHYLNEIYFRHMPRYVRGSYTSIDDMELELFANTRIGYVDMTVDDLFLYCEYLLAMFPPWNWQDGNRHSVYQDQDVRHQIMLIINNIHFILECTNHELLNTGTDEEPKYIIIESNREATQAAQLVEDSETAIRLLEYNHFSMKGHLSEKRDILRAMGDYLEPLLKSKKLQQAGYKQLESDAGFLLNNFNIRHNNKTGKNAKPFTSAMSDDELETWYDSTYHTLLTVIITNEQIDISKSLKDLKAQYGL